MTQYTYDIDSFSDLHKDAFGFRRRGENYARWLETASPDELQAEWDYLLSVLDARITEDERQAAEALKAFKVELAWMLDNGADSVETCVRWLHDTYSTSGDSEYLDYKLGVKYGTIKNLLETGVC